MAAETSRAILSPTGPAPVPSFRPALPYGLGGNLAGGASRAPSGMDAPKKMDTSYSNMITETLIARQPDDAQDNYEFAPLFVEQDKHDELILWSLQDLNAALMSAAVDRKRKIRGKAPSTFPCTIAQFRKRFRFGGFQIGAIHNPAISIRRFKTDRRTFTTQLQGSMYNVPNIWGSAARCGYDLGFQVCYVDVGGRGAATKRDWRGLPYDDGEGEVEIANTRALQIVPVVCKGVTVPLETLSLWDEKYATHSKEVVTLKFADPQAPAAQVVEAQVEITNTAFFIYVGRVMRVMGQASEFDTVNGMKSATAYRNLSVVRSQVDFDMLPVGKGFKWVV
jgi:hypothetical protein